VAALERNHRVPVTRSDPDGTALQQAYGPGDGMPHRHRAEEDEHRGRGETGDAEVYRARRGVRHGRILREQSLPPLPRDRVHDRHEIASRGLELLVAIHARGAVATTRPDPEAQRLDAIARPF